MFKKFLLIAILLFILGNVFAAAPTLSDINISPAYTNDLNYFDFPVTFNITASGDINADSSCWYQISNGNWNITDFNYDTNICTVTLLSSAGNDDFNFGIIIDNSTKDENATSSLLYYWRDSNAPSTTSSFNNVSTLTITATDAATNTGNGSGIQNTWYRINSGTWTDAGAVSSYELNLTENGSYTVDYFSIDNLDNNEATQDAGYSTTTFTVNVGTFSVRDFRETMCINAVGIPTSIWLIVFIIIIVLIGVIVFALQNPMEVSTTFLADNIQVLVPMAIIIILVIFMMIFFALMGGVVCATVV